MKIKRLLKKAFRLFKRKADTLHVLREDVYSNEEINEMTGRMIREQYHKQL